MLLFIICVYIRVYIYIYIYIYIDIDISCFYAVPPFWGMGAGLDPQLDSENARQLVN